MVYNVIIIGGGIAAHTAALYTARASLNPLVISGPELDQLSTTTLVENYPGFPKGIMGPELTQNCKEQAKKFGAKYMDGLADSFKINKKDFEVGIGKTKHKTKSVIIATGASARRLKIPGEDKYFGKGVSTCAVCLPPNESVIVNSSIKEIKDVNPLTKVLTIDGTYKHIGGFTRTDYKGKLIKIKPRFFTESVSLTPNHPVLSTNLIKDRSTSGKYISFTEPKWVQAGNLKKGDYVLYPRIKETKDIKEIKISDFIDINLKRDYVYPIVPTHTSKKVKNKITIDKDFMRLIGYFLAEGNTYKHMLRFYFGKHEKDYIKDVIRLLKKKFNLKPNVEHEKNVCRITIYSKILADLFKHLFGSYAHKKKLPHWVIILPKSKQRELIKGLWCGGGCIRFKDFCYVTNSRELAYQIRDVLLRLGVIPSIEIRDRDKINKWINKIEGRLVGFNYTKYHLIIGGQFLEEASKILEIKHPRLKTRKLICKHAWINKDHVILPIREVNEIDYKGPVLNLGVEENNTYIAKNFIVHNCDAALYHDKEAVVIGGGDSAMEESLALAKFTKTVTIVHRRDKFRASKIMQDKVFKLKNKINTIYNTIVTEVLGDGKFVTGVKLKNVKTNKISELKCNGVFLALGHVPNTAVFKGKVKLDKLGYIATDKLSRTSIPGVFAAGDCQDPIFRQAVTSAATGCQAAIQAEKYLEDQK